MAGVVAVYPGTSHADDHVARGKFLLVAWCMPSPDISEEVPDRAKQIPRVARDRPQNHEPFPPEFGRQRHDTPRSIGAAAAGVGLANLLERDPLKPARKHANPAKPHRLLRTGELLRCVANLEAHSSDAGGIRVVVEVAEEVLDLKPDDGRPCCHS